MKHAIPATRIDSLCGKFRIVQPEEGQRYTTDDLLVAWHSVCTLRRAVKKPSSFLDLGSGLCSVPMVLLWCFPSLRGIGVEIDPVRITLGRQSLLANGVAQRFFLIRGDIRTVCLKKKYGLVTSSPPYYTEKTGPVSTHPGRAIVRSSLHGSIEDYVQSADLHLVSGGYFTTVYPTAFYDRIVEAAQRYGFHMDTVVDVIQRSGKPPLFSVFSFVKTAAGRGEHSQITLRHRDLRFTSHYRKLRQAIGFPDPRG